MTAYRRTRLAVECRFGRAANVDSNARANCRIADPLLPVVSVRFAASGPRSLESLFRTDQHPRAKTKGEPKRYRHWKHFQIVSPETRPWEHPVVRQWFIYPPREYDGEPTYRYSD